MKSLLSVSVLVGVLALMVACQSAVNLDLQYTDAGAAAVPSTTPPAADAGTPVEEAAAPPPQVLGEDLEACPCDAAQGLACCVSNGGPSFCTTDQARCDGEKGGFFRCFGPDPNTESVCCLRRGPDKSETGLAGECKPGTVTVCRVDGDCPNNGKCTVTPCKDGVTIGVCDGQKACPN